jgi:hypothetical protein
MSDWISVYDRLPVGMNGNYTTYRPSAPSEARVTSTWYDSWHNGWSGKHRVTHWMPLPPPPKSVE